MITLYNAEITAQYDTQYIPVDGSVSVSAICILPDCISCLVTEEINGAYELAMQYVATGVNAAQIIVDRILGVDVPLVNSIGENLFRIYRVEKDLTGRIYVYARHVASDLSYIPVRNNTEGTGIRITSVNDWQILLREYATSSFPFWILDEGGSTPPGDVYRMKFTTVASAAAYLGGEELIDPDKTLLQIFGGEFALDNFTIRRYDLRGQVRDKLINYGENIDGLGIDDDLDGVYTSFILFYTGEAFSVASNVASTSYASLFPYARTQMVDWTEFIPETMTTRAQIVAELNRAAPIYARNHQELGNPVRKIEVNMVSAGIDEIFLGDFVPVRYVRHGTEINTNMRVVSYEWDVIMQRYNTVTLGAVKTSLAKVIAENAGTGEVVKSVNSRVASIASNLTVQEAALSGLTQRVSAAETQLANYKELGQVTDLLYDTSVDFSAFIASHFTFLYTVNNRPVSAGGHGFRFYQGSANYAAEVIHTDLGSYINRRVNGTWQGWEQIATISTSQPLFKTQNCSYTISLAAGASVAITAQQFGQSIPDGYALAGAIGYWGGDISFLVSEANGLATGTAVAMRVKNTYTSALNSKAASIKYLYIRNS